MPMMWWVVVHVIGAVLGAGAATINDVLFMRAIGSPEEGEAYKRYHRTLSLIAWTGTLLLIVSAFAFWRIKPEILHSQKIMVKIALTAIVTINGALMAKLLVPQVLKMKPADWTSAPKLKWAIMPGTILGVISLVTWYTLLALGAVGKVNWTAAQIVPWYVGALVLAWLGGTVIVHRRLATLKS